MNKKFNIDIELKECHIPKFLGMLKSMEILGGIGSSREITFFADGDGNFKPKFTWDIDIKPIDVQIYESDGKWNGKLKLNF